MSRAKDLFDRLVAGGEAEVKSFIAQPVTEELFLDYKRSADDGSGNALDPKDRENLAKAISGFGNSEGGVIIWGVDCKNDPIQGDIPTGPRHIQNPARFKSWLEQATTGLTVPPHTGVVHHAIATGYVITHIPSGQHAPYQAQPSNSYYIRAGSNFARAPHAVLAGMFGRRPQPAIKHHHFVPREPIRRPHGIETQVSINLHNYGRGIAEDIFVNFEQTSVPGELCSVVWQPSTEQEIWSGRTVLDSKIQMITKPGVRLPPEATLMPFSLVITISNPITADLEFTGMCGCSGGEPWTFTYKRTAAEIVDATDRLLKSKVGDPDRPVLFRRFNRIMFEQ